MKNEANENSTAENRNDMHHRGGNNGRTIGENMDKRHIRQDTRRLETRHAENADVEWYRRTDLLTE